MKPLKLSPNNFSHRTGKWPSLPFVGPSLSVVGWLTNLFLFLFRRLHLDPAHLTGGGSRLVNCSVTAVCSVCRCVEGKISVANALEGTTGPDRTVSHGRLNRFYPPRWGWWWWHPGRTLCQGWNLISWLPLRYCFYFPEHARQLGANCNFADFFSIAIVSLLLVSGCWKAYKAIANSTGGVK